MRKKIKSNNPNNDLMNNKKIERVIDMDENNRMKVKPSIKVILQHALAMAREFIEILRHVVEMFRHFIEIFKSSFDLIRYYLKTSDKQPSKRK